MSGTPEDIVIWQPYGGLGDNLQYSTLPELFAARSHRVFVSKDNAVRNQEIHDLVWGCNPYVSGVSDAPPNAGAVHHETFMKLPRTSDYIRRWERVHGLEPANDLPKIYYPCKPRPDFADRIIVDVTSNSTVYEKHVVDGWMAYTVRTFGYAQPDCVQIAFSQKIAEHEASRFDGGTYRIRDIFEYCDIIASCRAVITVFSGAAVLAATIKRDRERPLIHCLSNRNQYNRKFYVFGNVEYTIV
jgi:hypothetical protein